ncbi:MAG: hypothetical protein LPJ89_03675 [Hymenobacteraceae bacterium]|nr:hypothetical protein [Hymenobacteraceae bacterium]MDX5397193.1 hypothetical protein [Hymenobacteraceae bacterium]MDX5442863.1 hypothetical protein [Hymenobacteraceae bacterium]MDX5513269.1 hypothetical protein [Hymenobacteraceae bacterium]
MMKLLFSLFFFFCFAALSSVAVAQSQKAVTTPQVVKEIPMLQYRQATIIAPDFSPASDQQAATYNPARVWRLRFYYTSTQTKAANTTKTLKAA